MARGEHVSCAPGVAPCEGCAAIRWRAAVEEAVARYGGRALVWMSGPAVTVRPITAEALAWLRPLPAVEVAGGLLRFGMESPEWAGFEVAA